MLKIALIDKQELFRESFQSWLVALENYQVVFSSSDFRKLEQSLRPDFADVLIVDIKDLLLEDWEILGKITHNLPALKTIVLSDDINSDHITTLMDMRIRGFFSKCTNLYQLKLSIDDIVSSDNHFDLKLGSKVREKLIDKKIKGNKTDRLPMVEFSPREIEILSMVYLEMTNHEISKELSISVRTIETHRRRMIEKTDSKTMLGVVIYAIEKNMIATGSYLQEERAFV